MNARRHQNYRRALFLIFALEGSAGIRDADVLRELAQDMLLTRETELHIAERQLDHLARVLTLLVNEGELSLSDSTDLWRTLRECGPRAGDAHASVLESQASTRPQEVAR